MQHFLRKMPTSFDPYVAYGVRLFIDFLFTESLVRLVLVLVWTGLGVIFADIAPALWIDAGLRHIWRRFRRDLYVMSRSISSVPYPRTRTVRFSPSQSPSVISSASPSVFTTITQDPTLLSEPVPILRKRHVPGAFPGEVSETDTDIGSVLGLRDVASELSTATPGTTQRRFSSFMRREFGSETDLSTDMNDLDEANLSSSASSDSTETPDLSAMNPSEIPDYEEEEVVATEKKPEESDRELTPKQNNITFLPTPQHSFAMGHDEPDGVRPPPEVPFMPDEDWEDISRREANPTPPPSSKELPPIPLAQEGSPLGTSSLSPPSQQVSPNDMPSTTSTQNPAYGDNASHPQDTLIDFTTNSPAFSQQQQQQSSSDHPSLPPPRFSDIYEENFSYPQSGSPPPPFQETYRQDDVKWKDSGATTTPVEPIAGEQVASNNADSNSNDNILNKPNKNDTGDHDKKEPIVGDLGAEQAQSRNDQAQAQAGSSTTPQTRVDVLNKGKARATGGNGGNSTAKQQQNKSRSGQNTPKARSKPASDDEGTDVAGSRPKVQQGNAAQSTSTAWGNRPTFAGGIRKDADEVIKSVADGGAKGLYGSVASDADNNNLKTEGEVEKGKPAQSTATTWVQLSSVPADKGTANTAGNNTEPHVELTQDKLPRTEKPTDHRSPTSDNDASDDKKGFSGKAADLGAGITQIQTSNSPTALGTDHSRADPDKDKDKTNANAVHILPQNEQAEAGPSSVPKYTPTPPSPSSSEQSDLPETSDERLKEALKFRQQWISLQKKVPKLDRQYNGAVERNDEALALLKKAEFDVAVKENEELSKKIARRLAAQNLTDSEATIDVTELSDKALGPEIVEILVQLLLRNEPQLTVTVGKGATGNTQQRKLETLLHVYGLKITENKNNRSLIIIKLPHIPAS